MSEMSVILPCTNFQCKSAFQDEQYGKRMRVHNRTKQNKQAAEQKWRCTACKNERGEAYTETATKI